MELGTPPSTRSYKYVAPTALRTHAHRGPQPMPPFSQFHLLSVRKLLLMFQTKLPMFFLRIKMTIDRISAQRVADGVKPCRAAILLVEDDTSVRALVTRLLALKNYRVFSADSGPAALPLWEQHRNEIDLLLTDVMMPQGMSGRDLAAHCHSQNPRLKVIFTSGYNMELSAPEGWLPDGVNFLQKPYRPEQLLQLIETVLAAAPNVKSETYAANSPR